MSSKRPKLRANISFIDGYETPMTRFLSLVGLLSASCVIGALLFLPEPRSALPTTTFSKTALASQSEDVAFRDTSLDWGLMVKHTQSSEHLTALTETLGSGLCVFDFNQDGWMDIFFVGGSGHSRHYGRKSWWSMGEGNRLLMNMAGQRFEDVTEQAGLGKRIWGMGCATADLDNDQLEDLLVTGLASTTLFRNLGSGKFEDVTIHSGLTSEFWSTGASIADFNRDGLLDIYVSNYVRYKKEAPTFEFTSGFESTGKVAFSQTLYDAEPNQLFVNQGSMVFKDIAEQAGVNNSDGRSLGSRWLDLNEDAWLDLVVINDHGSPNQVFINQQGKAFARGQERYAAFEITGVHDLLPGSFDASGKEYFFMTRGMTHPPVFLGKKADAGQNGASTYADHAWEHNLAHARLLPFTSWGAAAGDFNNDGLTDIHVANGMVMPDIDSHYVAQAQANSLFINQGEGRFQLQKPDGIQHPYSSRAAVTADLNNDGWLEILVSNNNDPLQIFENQARPEQHWIGLDFSRNALAESHGAVVEITSGPDTTRRIVRPNQGFLAQGDPRMHVGLGASDAPATIRIRWPDGQQDSHEHIAVDMYYRIDKVNHAIAPAQSVTTLPAPAKPWLTELDDAAVRAYSDILLQAPAQQVRSDLLQTWPRAAMPTRKYMLDRIQKQWDVAYLPLVRRALLETDASLRLTAIEILRQAELELSVVWLLPLLDDADPAIQCATAEVFTFFFNEEEAVTHRKTLAISPLIRMLETGPDAAQVCAAHALAAAENKRAIKPLLALANSGRDVTVRASAIRALGLIRDTSARAPLVALVQAPNTPAPIVAAALIALSRLHDTAAASLFDSWFSHASINLEDTLAIIRRLDVLTVLFNEPDGVVFPKNALEQRLTELVRNRIPAAVATRSQDSARILAALQAIEAGAIDSLLDFVEAQLSQQNTQLQQQALATLATLHGPRASKLLEQHLLRAAVSPDGLPQWLAHPDQRPKKMTQSTRRSLPLSQSFFSALASQAQNSQRQFDTLAGLIPVLADPGANMLFNSLLAQPLTAGQFGQLFELCASDSATLSITAALDIAEIRAKLPETGLRLAYARCYFGAAHSSSGNMPELRKRLILNSFINDPELNEHDKMALLLTSAASDALTAQTLLLNRVQTDDGNLMTQEQRFSALRLIADQGKLSTLESMLWNTFKERRNGHQARLEAAALLMRTDQKGILDNLDNQYISQTDHQNERQP